MNMQELRTYLCTFFAEFNYRQQDADCLLSAFDRIVMCAGARDLLAACVKAYEDDYTCDFAELVQKADGMAGLTGVQEYTAELLVCLCLTPRLRALYAERGISQEIYRATVLDLKYKLEECVLIYGVAGTFVPCWQAGFFRLTRFCLGRLQFEVVPFKATYEKNGVTLLPDTKVINVHIPRSGEPLTERACREAYLLAKEFFRDEVQNDPCPFVCHSYLLYPDNAHFLPPHTNTYRFLKSFDIYEVEVDKERENLWRMFDTQEKNVDKLPTDTSMRRAFVAHLKNGGKMGCGRGVLFV